LNRTIFVILLFVTVAYLSLHRLDNTSFWDDEADTGIIAKNFLLTGRLTGWDGRNLYAYRDGGALDENLRTRNAPLDILVCAASFKLFGISTWSGRIPFVLIGLLSLWIFMLIIKNDFGEDNWLWFYMMTVWALSVIFLLNIRQCRYYAPSLLFGLLSYYAWRQCLTSHRAHYFFLLSLSSILAFYTNPMLCAAFVMALGVVHLIFYRNAFSLREWKIMFLAISLFIILTAPYAIYYRIWEIPASTQNIPTHLFQHHLFLIYWNLRDLNQMTAIPWMVFIGLIYLYLRYRKTEPPLKTALEWATLSFLNMFFISLIGPMSIYNEILVDLRFLIISIPFLLGLVGLFLWYVHRSRRWAAGILFAVILCTNLLTWTPTRWNFRWLLPAYLYEIHHDYPTPWSAAVDFLERNAKQDDLVMCIPDEYTYPVMFYTGNKIKFCCSLDSQAYLPLTTIKKLNAPLLLDENFPDWIILFGGQPFIFPTRIFLSRVHKENGINVQYSYILNKTLNIYWGDTSRPELPQHSFVPNTDFNPNIEAIYVLKKTSVVIPEKVGDQLKK
jgi:hypothetical protein